MSIDVSKRRIQGVAEERGKVLADVNKVDCTVVTLKISSGLTGIFILNLDS